MSPASIQSGARQALEALDGIAFEFLIAANTHDNQRGHPKSYPFSTSSTMFNPSFNLSNIRRSFEPRTLRQPVPPFSAHDRIIIPPRPPDDPRESVRPFMISSQECGQTQRSTTTTTAISARSADAASPFIRAVDL